MFRVESLTPRQHSIEIEIPKLTPPLEVIRLERSVRKALARLPGSKTNVVLSTASNRWWRDVDFPFIAFIARVRGRMDVGMIIRFEKNSSLFPLNFSFVTTTQKLEREVVAAATRVYGPPVYLNEGRGVYDVVERFRLNDFYHVGVSPSDRRIAGVLPSYLPGCAARFCLAMSREIRLGSRPGAPPLKTRAKVTKGALCPICHAPIVPGAMSCRRCAWSEDVFGGTGRNGEPTYGVDLADT